MTKDFVIERLEARIRAIKLELAKNNTVTRDWYLQGKIVGLEVAIVNIKQMEN